MKLFLVFSYSEEEAEAENQVLCLVHTAATVVELGLPPSQVGYLEFALAFCHTMLPFMLL